MTRFIGIRADRREIQILERPHLRAALREVGLSSGDVDHGVLQPNLAYVVAQYGLYAPPDAQHYWSFGQRLVAGNAVLHGFNDQGDTIDTPPAIPQIAWLTGAEAIEACAAGKLMRPEVRVNGVPVWSWPQPTPYGWPG